MPAAARIGDDHVCFVRDEGPHRGGQVETGCETVLVAGRPAAREGDVARCEGAEKDEIVRGEPTVIVAGRPAARLGDATEDGFVTSGEPTVQIGAGLGLSRRRRMLRTARRRARG